MDWVGNRGHDVTLPFNYLTRARWDEAFRRARLRIVSQEEKLGLYPMPARLIFERHSHFVALAAPVESSR